MAVVTADSLSLSFGDRAILDGTSLAIQDGERVGLVGNNGSGKSTLARVIAGTVKPDAGTVTMRSGAEVAYLPQEPRFTGTPTARRVISSGLGAWSRAHEEYERVARALDSGNGNVESLLARQTRLAAEIERLGGWNRMHQVESISGHLGVHRLDDSVERMSGGERRRVDLARILVASPSVAILDEPTNHLDIATIEWLERFLVEEYKGALLLVTHDRYVLNSVVSRTIELEHGHLYSYDGGWEDFLAAKMERLAHAARAEANRQNMLRRELDWLRRSPKARTTKQKARVQRAEALIDAAPTDADRSIGELAFNATRSGKTMFELEGLGVELGGKTLIDGLDLVVSDGERLGIVGPNGIGKTSLMRVLLGELSPAQGQVRIAKNTRFAYFDQERTDLDDDATVLENVGGNREQVSVAGRDMNVRSYLSNFLFDSHKQRQAVASLSGGERARVMLAKFLLEEANVLLLDEPTNDLDVATLGALEEMLVSTNATVLFVTHDRYFLDRVATGVLAFEGDGSVVRYEGSYQAYRAAAEREPSKLDPTEKAPPTKTKAPAKKKTDGLTFTERHELDGLMPKIEAAEEVVGDLEKKLADPQLYAERGEEVPGLNARLESARAELESLLSRWEELEEKRAAE